MELQNVLFFLWGVLWAIYFIMDGYDLGIGSLLFVLGKDNEQKRVMYHTMGPFWDANEVWLITAGAVTFAAFPGVYAVMFSSLYSALMLILFALIIRGVSLEFRNKVEDLRWQKLWDIGLFIGSLVPALLFGVAFANIFRGVPIDGKGIYHGTLFMLLNPYGLLGGVLFLLLFLVHGALRLAVKSEGILHERAVDMARKLWPMLLAVVVIFLLASKFTTRLYDNYLAHLLLFVFLLVTLLTLVGVKFFWAMGSYWKAWFSSALTIAGVTFFGIIGLFPSMFPSSLNPAYDLTAHNASSSPLTLKIILVVVIVFVPIVIAYQIWAYSLFKGKITKDVLADEEAY